MKTIPTPMFDAKSLTREDLLSLVVLWWPRGSGPLSMLSTIVSLLIQIGELRGFAPFTPEEVEALSHVQALSHARSRGLWK